MRIALLTRTLEVGGTERQVAMLAEGLHERGHEVMVFAFYPEGEFLGHVLEAGVNVWDGRKQGRWDFAYFARLGSAMSEFAPDVLYSFLPVPNGVAALMRGALPAGTLIVWGIRGARLPYAMYGDPLRFMADRAPLLLSFGADLIVTNSRSVVGDCLAAGCLPPFEVVYNASAVPPGVCSQRERADARAGLGIDDGTFVFGHVSRLDPVKDIPTLVKAFAMARRKVGERILLLVVGGGRKEWDDAARQAATDAGVEEDVLFTGPTTDVARLMCAMDSFVLSSKSESFPNALLEAAAAGRFCITTDAGDARVIVGQDGLVVPPGDPGALAEAMVRAMDVVRGGWDPSRQVERIRREFSQDALVDRTVGVLEHYRLLKAGGKLGLFRRIRARLEGRLSFRDRAI